MNLSILVSGANEVEKTLSEAADAYRRAHYFATINAGERARDKVAETMPSVIDRPTPFILRSLRLHNGKGQNVGMTIARRDANRKVTSRIAQTSFEVHLGFKDVFESARHDPVTDTMLPEVEGGPRKPNRAEQRLRRSGILNSDEFLVTAKTAPRDNYGNVPAGEWNRMLSDLRTFNEAGSTKNSRYKKGRGHYIVIEFPSNGVKGIFKSRPGYKARSVGDALAVWWIVRGAPTYKPRLDFYRIARDEFLAKWPAQFDKTLNRELAKLGAR